VTTTASSLRPVKRYVPIRQAERRDRAAPRLLDVVRRLAHALDLLTRARTGCRCGAQVPRNLPAGWPLARIRRTAVGWASARAR
jgi:hypothetical protein